MTWDARTALDVVERIHVEGEPLTTQDLDLHDISEAQEALGAWRAAKRQEQAAKQVTKVAGVRLAELLRNGGAARAADVIVRYTHPSTERCIDPDGFAAYVTGQVTAGAVRLSEVFNPNQAKKSWMPTAVRDTFYEKTFDDDPRLIEVPLAKAPKFLQTLDNGEILFGREES